MVEKWIAKSVPRRRPLATPLVEKYFCAFFHDGNAAFTARCPRGKLAEIIAAT